MNIKNYLKYIQDNESLFPIDSFPEKEESKESEDTDNKEIRFENNWDWLYKNKINTELKLNRRN